MRVQCSLAPTSPSVIGDSIVRSSRIDILRSASDQGRCRFVIRDQDVAELGFDSRADDGDFNQAACGEDPEPDSLQGFYWRIYHPHGEWVSNHIALCVEIVTANVPDRTCRPQ